MTDSIDDSFIDFFQGIFYFIDELIKGFNIFSSFLFQNGNYVLFIIFLTMGIVLLFNAKEVEEHQKLYARNLEYIKKKGRAGTLICILLAIGFLSKGLLVFLDWCFSSLPILLENQKKFHLSNDVSLDRYTDLRDCIIDRVLNYLD